MSDSLGQKWLDATVDRLALCSLAGMILLSTAMKAQNGGRETTLTLNIALQVLDGRSGKPLAGQHVLVFTGLSSNGVKTHAAHTDVTTDKDGAGTVTIYPAETQWLQVFVSGRVLCYTDPNQISFSISEIVSKGLLTPNNCSALSHEASPGHFIVFARPARFMEKIKR